MARKDSSGLQRGPSLTAPARQGAEIHDGDDERAAKHGESEASLP
jgi:hypothetical protein